MQRGGAWDVEESFYFYSANNSQRINMEISGDYAIIGPFSVYVSDSTNSIPINCTVYGYSNNSTIPYQIINGSLNSGNGRKQFYIRVSKYDAVKRVKVYGSYSYYHRWEELWGGYPWYECTNQVKILNGESTDEGQPVVSSEMRRWWVYEEWVRATVSDYVEWNNIDGELLIEKVRADKKEVSLPGVEFRIVGPGYDQIHTTDSNGRISIKHMTPGTYQIIEKNNPNYGYTTLSTYSINVYSGAYRETYLNNVLNLGRIVLGKKGEDTGDKLAGVTFILKGAGGYVQGRDTNRHGIIQAIGSADFIETGFTPNINSASKFTTDQNGNLVIDHILSGKYLLIEVDSPYYRYDSKITKEIEVPNSEKTVYVEVQNPPRVGKLTIKKIGTPNNEPLPNIEFKLKEKSKGYVIAYGDNGSVSKVTQKFTFKDIGFTNYESAGTTFVTDSRGYIELIDILEGCYDLIEIKSPYYKYDVEYQGYVNVVRGVPKEGFASNPQNGTDLIINKVDSDGTDVNFEGVKFKIRGSGGYVVAHNDSGPVLTVNGSITLKNMTYSPTIEGGTTFNTDSKGHLEVIDLKEGNYEIIETEIPIYGYEATFRNSVSAPRKKYKSDKVEQRVPNEKQTGNLKIKKVDTDSGKPLDGVTFKVKGEKGYLIAHGSSGPVRTVNGEICLKGASYTGNINEATSFITDKDGNIGIYNIWKGTYEVTEYSIGDHDTYELDPNYITWESSGRTGKGMTATIEVKRQKSQYTTESNPQAFQLADIITFKNRKKYTKISGYVWEDIADSKTEDGNDRDDVYRAGTKDQLLKGIPVELKKANGELATIYDPKTKATSRGYTTTGNNGEYRFAYILIEDIPQLYVEFKYNGLSYDTVEVKTDLSNGSKVGEEGRQAFNDKFNTIKFGQAVYSNGQHALDLRYDTSKNNISQLYFRDDRNKSLYNYGYSGSEDTRDPITGVDSKYTISASTREAYNGRYLNAIMEVDEIRRQDVNELANINLGIKAREKVDLSVVKDLERIKVHINGEDHIYNYADRFNSTLYYENGKDGYNMEPAVKFGGKYGTATYTRALYASDIYYGDTSKGSNGTDTLKVDVTYKIGIKNTASSNIKTIVNEIVDYYDTKYIDFKVGTNINNDGSIRDEIRLTTGNERVGNYIKKKIPINLELMGNEEKFIYVVLRINPQDIKQILGDRKETVKLDNIIEISSYSVKDKNNNSYASIDKDSQPDNIELNNTQKYEDDTDKAPGLNLVLQENRKVTGVVFEDKVNGNNSSGIMSGQIRQGDGIYDATSGDKGIKDVTVKLIDSNGNVTKLWDDNLHIWVDAIKTTDSAGNYTIPGFVPGQYRIVYVWGNKEYKVQDYKSTIVDQSSYNLKTNNKEWYKDEFKKQYLKNVEWNTARNTEIRRSDAIDNYETRQKIDKQTELMINANKEAINNYSGQIKLADGTTEPLQDKMESTTPIFEVNIEYDKEPTNLREEFKLNHVKSVDFGIVERAKQALTLTKNIKDVKIVLASGNALVDAKIENGALKEEVNHAVFLPGTNGKNAQLKMELDSELIEGAQLRIEYGINIENISELDYTSEDYYYYGKGHGDNESNIVTLEAQSIIDYVDNSMGIEESVNEFGKIVQGINQKNELIEKGLLENSTQMKQLLSGMDQILIVEVETPKKLKPTSGENKVTELLLTTSRLLSNATDDDVEIGNSAEIIQIQKTGGSSLVTTPGNYIPKVTSTFEYDDDKAEDVTVVPPTGKNVRYIMIALLSISVLALLGTGIVLIKKYVVKK